MATLLYRLGRFAARRPLSILSGVGVLLAAVVMLAVLAPGTLQSTASIPGSPAQVASDTMDEHFPDGEASGADWLLEAPEGQTFQDPAVAAAATEATADTAAVEGVAAVSDPLAMVSPDGTTALATIDFTTPEGDEVPADTLEAVEQAGASFEESGGTSLHGGDSYEESHSVVSPTEAVGVVVALIVLLLTFGSMWAAGLPLLTAILGVGGSAAAIIGAANVFEIADTAISLTVMLALAVGIDYALLVLSRHRRQLAEGMDVRESVGRAIGTAGSAVVFAGATVVIALAGLTVAGVPTLTSMGLAAAAGVTIAVLCALVVLPALMSLVGERLRPRAGTKAMARDTGRTTGAATRWIALVTRHPKRFIVAVVLGLAVIAAPALQLELALTDAGSEAESSSQRQVYDAKADAFGPGANGPLVVLVEGGDTATVTAAADDVQAELAGVDGIARVGEPVVAEDGSAALVQVIPETGPREAETAELVTTIQDAVAPVGTETDTYVAVTGSTAVGIDVADKLTAALVPFTLVVVGLSLLLLLIAFRSWTIPIKATVGFLFSVAAAFGATVAVFQWGWLAGLLGVPSLGPIASFAPIVVMAVLFGLAMDYEVFLVSAMREQYSRSRRATEAIVAGGRNAGRVVVSAAAIMIAVFASFLFSHSPDLMPIAFALAVGVMVDAFVVRLTLVPAVMQLLGDRAWSLPGWLDRLVPKIDVEGHDLDTDPDTEHGDDTGADASDDAHALAKS